MDYSHLTEEKIATAMQEYFYGKPKEGDITIEQLKEKILPGYFYTFSTTVHKGMTVGTGRGGILSIIDRMHLNGIPAAEIQKNIFLMLKNNQRVSLADATVKSTKK